MVYKIVPVRENPELLEEAVTYFSSKWDVPEEVYRKSIGLSIDTQEPLPRWYLLRKGDETVGSVGLIENDFIKRQDLFPWLCALFVEDTERGNGLGERLIMYVEEEARKLGFPNLYLSTDLEGFYEKFGYDFLSVEEGVNHTTSRVYTIELNEE